MKLRELLKINVDCMSVRWIDSENDIKFINNQDIWINDDIEELFTEQQLCNEVEYITIIDDELIVMLKEDTK